MVRVTVPAAVHNRTAYWELLAVRPVLAYVPVVRVNVMSASAEIVCVPATATSIICEIALLTVSPHCPDSVPWVGRVKPIRDVFAIYCSY
jgi:hypothetical protein